MKSSLNFLKLGYRTFFNYLRYVYITNEIRLYAKNGRRPWSRGYSHFKESLIKSTIQDQALMTRFKHSLSLPFGYGEFIDERIVEYPWLISRISEKDGTLLDAGSALNYLYLLEHPGILNKEISIVTLEPELNCYWKQRISYLFSDLRSLPLKENYFDTVVSISTLEHVGMNNSIYSSNAKWQEKKNLDFLKAITELRRVTKPGGKVYISVPYGKYTDFGWYQQFNSDLINRLIETFKPSKVAETYFCYEKGGWNFADKDHCGNFEGFNIHDTKYFNSDSQKDYDPDYAAGSRSIAALELWK